MNYGLQKLVLCCLALLLVGCYDFVRALPKPTIGAYALTRSTIPADWIWTFQAEERLIDPVVVHEGVAVYLRTPSTIIALHPQTGEILWQRTIGSSFEIAPVVNKTTLFVTYFDNRSLEALDGATGVTLWRFTPADYVSARAGWGPLLYFVVVDGERLYVVVNLLRGTEIFLLDAADGRILAQAPPEISSPSSAPSAFFVGPDWLLLDSYGFWLLDKELTSIRQRFPGAIDSYRRATVTPNMALTSKESVRAFDLPTYRLKWEFEDDCPRSWDIPVSRLIDQSAVYVTTTCGFLYKLNKESGAVIWKQDVNNDINSFVIAGNRGYFATQFASLHAVDLANGAAIGSAHFTPGIVSDSDYQYLVVGKEIMVVTYGNSQAFGFKLR